MHVFVSHSGRPNFAFELAFELWRWHISHDDSRERHGDYMGAIYERMLDAADGEPPMPVAVAAAHVMTDALLQRYPDDTVTRLQRFWDLMGRMHKRLLGEP